ncbi:MAG TPA: hypothetical protein VE093_16305 [Polyangiaceae bacterium]|nr:hypothetical protein [Polyangiaceae bacterium]
MTTIGLFRVDINAKTLSKVKETDLAVLGLKERHDLQEWVDKNPGVLGEDLLIIAKECNSFDATAERADLVALDKFGSLVIIELKRDDSGTNVHWQAVKYASYFARAKPDVIVELLAKHASISVDEATTRVLAFIGQDDLGVVNREQRIILVSHRFAREVTNAVLWLRDHDVDVSCVQLTPYVDVTTKALYMQATTIIPVPGTDDYTVTAASPTMASAVKSGRGKKEDDITAFLRRVAADASAKLDEAIRPHKTSRWAGVGDKERYFNVWYQHAPWEAYSFQYRLNLYDNDDGNRELSIGLVVVYAAAQKAGLQAGQLASLKASMKTFGTAEGRSSWFEPGGKWAWCGVTLPAPVLDDALREKGAAALQAIIEHFTPAIEDLFKAVNEQEA